MGKFKKANSKAQKTRRHREADERTAAEASAADADGHADSNAGDADDAGAQSSSGGGGSSSGGGSGGELKVNLWSLISSAESNHIFDVSSHFSERSRSSRPLVAPARRARSSRPLVAPGAAEGSRKSARLSSPGGRTTYAFDHGEVSQSSQVGFNHHMTKPHRVTPHHLRWAKARTTPVDVSTETKCRCQGHGSSRAMWHINMCVPIGDSTREMASDSRRHRHRRMGKTHTCVR